MGGRKAEKSADFSKIRDAEGRIITISEVTRNQFVHQHTKVRIPLDKTGVASPSPTTYKRLGEKISRKRVPLSAS